jgi:hypothetical protein
MTDVARYPNIYGDGKFRALQILPMYAEGVPMAGPATHASAYRATPMYYENVGRSGRYKPFHRPVSRLSQ